MRAAPLVFDGYFDGLFLASAAVKRSVPALAASVGNFRVFYDVSEKTVEILAIIAKSELGAWLAQFGSP